MLDILKKTPERKVWSFYEQTSIGFAERRRFDRLAHFRIFNNNNNNINRIRILKGRMKKVNIGLIIGTQLRKDTTIILKLFHCSIIATIPTLKGKKLLYFLPKISRQI